MGSEDALANIKSFDIFKDSTGRLRTRSLFIEHLHPSYPAFFTLDKVDKGKYVSLYRKYMEIADPTEYRFAVACFGCWDNWKHLTNLAWFNYEYLQHWREELDARLRSDHFFKMQTIRENGGDSPSAVQATKWLAERYGKADKPKKSKRGRPSNEEKEGLLKQEAHDEGELKEDAERIGLL